MGYRVRPLLKRIDTDQQLSDGARQELQPLIEKTSSLLTLNTSK